MRASRARILWPCSSTCTRVLFVLASLSAPNLFAAEQAGACIDVPGFEAITSSLEARGDTTAFVDLLGRALAAHPDGQGAALMIRRLAEVRGDSPDLGHGVIPALEEALTKGFRDVLTRDRALSVLAAMYAEEGRWDDARKAMERRGIVRHWLLVGPFGATRRALHDHVFGPEDAQRRPIWDVTQAFVGASGPVSWRQIEVGAFKDGFTPADRTWPDSGCAYALSQVRAPAGTRAILTVVCRGSVKLWWNGEIVADFDRARGFYPDRVEVAVQFGQGWNRLLVKDTSQRFELAARLVASDGRGPVTGLKVCEAGRIESQEASPGSARLAVAEAPPPEGGGPFAEAARAIQLADLGLRPQALSIMKAAAESATTSAHLAWLHARMLEEAEYLPRTLRNNEARSEIKAALQRDPSFVPALEREARLHDDDGKPEEALRVLRVLCVKFPSYVPTHRSAVIIARRMGWEAEMLAEVADLSQVRPHSTFTRLVLADYYGKKENRAKQLELYREALKEDATLAWVAARVAALERDQGDLADAERIARELAARDPDDAAPRRLLADVRRARGDVGGALELLSSVEERRGGDPDELERIANVLVEAGEGRAAVPYLERALSVAPGRFNDRRLLARLRGGEDLDFARPWSIDARDRAAHAPAPDRYPKADSVCLLDQTVSRIYRDGSRVDVVHEIHELLTDAGVQRYHSIRVPGEILELRTFGRDGRVYEPVLAEGSNDILMPKLEPGAVIDYEYRAVYPQRPAFQFDSAQFFFRDPDLVEPLVQSRYVVIADKGFDLERIERNMPAKPLIEDRGDTVVFVWEVCDSNRMDEEPFMPDKDELLPSVELVQRRSWEDMAELYREQLAGRTRLTPELRSKAEDLTRGIASDALKARRIHDFVLEHVRGDAAANDAVETLLERSGSRLVLFKALLDAAGVPSRFAMCAGNPRLSPVKIWDPPRPELLSEPVLVVEPSDDKAAWIVDRGRFLPYGLLPQELLGATAMLLGRVSEFTVVPEASFEDAENRSALSMNLSGRDASVSGTVTMLGADSYPIKDRVVTTARPSLKNFVEGLLNQNFRGARLQSFGFPDVDVRGAPFAITFTAIVPEQVKPRNHRFEMRTGLVPIELTRELAGKPERELPMLIRSERAQHDVVDIDLGPAFAAEALPRNVLLKDRFGVYSLTFGLEGHRIRVARSFRLTPARLEPAEYASVLRFCRELDAAEKKWIELREVAR